jgi:hypothetical protein
MSDSPIIDIHTERRYSLAKLGGPNRTTIVQLEHSDNLEDFLPIINAGEGAFSLIDHDPYCRVADPDRQFVSFLSGFEIARFTYTPISLVSGVSRGNGRSYTGRFTPNYRYAQVNRMTLEDLHAGIESYYRSGFPVEATAEAV